jgi:hypothetical protein
MTHWTQARERALRNECRTLGEFYDEHPEYHGLFEANEQAEKALEALDRAHLLGWDLESRNEGGEESE